MSPIELQLEDIYNGKATMIKDRKYFSTKQYIEPFVDRMDKACQGNFLIKAVPANQISLTPQGDINTEDIVFNRINIEAVLPDEYAMDGHKKVVGMVYALDTRKPVVKQYVGAIRSACTNLCVFNPDALSVQELEPETAINYSFVGHALALTDDIAQRLKALTQAIYTKQDVEDVLGTWIDRCINNKYANGFGTIKLAESAPIEAYKDVFYDEKSDYYTAEEQTTGFNLYNAFTHLISNGRTADIVNRFEKTYLVSKIMGIE